MKEEYLKLKKHYSINMERGWPSEEQLDMVMPMLDTVSSETNLVKEVDYRAYAGTGGIDPLKKIFADVLEVETDEIYIGGTMSTTMMYDIVNKGMLFGLQGGIPWKDVPDVSFICPSPGYEKHFKICETFGIKMISVPIYDDGPDMDIVEDLVKNHEEIKGIWCVPLYSNPTGSIYSDDVVRRLAKMETAAKDFTIFWDNAYVVHHLTDEEPKILNMIRECEKAGRPDRVFEFTSTSKITFPGGGVGICASSKNNIDWLKKNSLLQLKSGDKVNQYRHALFFKDVNGLKKHMKCLRSIIEPKFKIVDEVLQNELLKYGLVKWNLPKGGYFVNVELVGVSAAKVWEICRDVGVKITPAGSTFPYGNDEKDAYIRIAPTYLACEDLRCAMEVFCEAVKLVADI
ncbi:MAG: aminotransferase class I/II-fold pyridoxal phosphate-dependent enzyme [Lachnospiraceae bacterium]|jgi:DNA-binding transcriptional MocR family regulator|nr:aminotransferase class I/II-fold pyridoxal phosphate-dependent enzyme [Lachnospiraceae bacterium]